MYDEKVKSKSHPFAGHLRPTEEVLWMSAQARPSAWYQLASIGTIVVVVAVSVGIGIMSDNDLDTDERMNILIIVMGGTLALAVVALLIGLLWRALTSNLPPEQAYAITNERLLYRNKKNVSSIPLEHVPSVSLFLGDNGKGTFSFGALFPMWPDIEDAIRIKHLIDDAQKKRMQEL